MPVQDCTVNGKPGRRWGKSGKCYTGKGAEKKAKKQGAAAHARSEDPKIRRVLRPKNA